MASQFSPDRRVVDTNIQNEYGRITDLDSVLAKSTALNHLLKLTVKHRRQVGSNPHWNDLLWAILHDNYYFEYGIYDTMGTDYEELALRSTSSGLIAKELGLFFGDSHQDIIEYLSHRGGGCIELYPEGPYILFRDFLKIAPSLLSSTVV